MMRNVSLLSALALLWVLLIGPAAATTIASPDGRIQLTVETDGEGRPLYSIRRSDEALIAPSQLGFLFTDADPIRRNFRIIGEERTAHDEQWEQPWGERRFVRDNHRELLVHLGEGAGGIDVRIDGVDTFALTSASGGYSIPVPVNKTYTIRFTAPELTAASPSDLGAPTKILSWSKATELPKQSPASLQESSSFAV